MIFINLLPHRERARERARRDFRRALAGAALLGCLLAVLAYLGYQHLIGTQIGRNDYLRGQVAELKTQIREVTRLNHEIAALEARQDAVRDLQVNRNLAVRLLSGLAKGLPDGVLLSQIKQQGDLVQINGLAQSNARISELLRNLTGSGDLTIQPELKEVTASNLTMDGGSRQRAYKFTIDFRSHEMTRALESSFTMNHTARTPG